MFRKKKKTLRTIFHSVPSNVQNLTVFSTIYMIRIRFFGPWELIQRRFSVDWYLGCTQRECKPNENIIKEYREIQMFESRICAGATEKLPGCEKPLAQTVAWSQAMEGHARKMRRTMLWVRKQESGATVQRFKSLPGWSSIEAGWRNTTSVWALPPILCGRRST